MQESGMIVEQIRYFLEEDVKDQVIEVRREVTRLRTQMGLPGGYILVADPTPDDGPSLVWQCGYEDESQMGMAESSLIGNKEYEAARDRLGSLVTRVEFELYIALEGDGE